jgi:hypothetical protein
MADDVAELKKARTALLHARRTRVNTIVTTGAGVTDVAMDSFVTAQEAIEAIDRAIEELEEVEEEDEYEDNE